MGFFTGGNFIKEKLRGQQRESPQQAEMKSTEEKISFTKGKVGMCYF